MIIGGVRYGFPLAFEYTFHSDGIHAEKFLAQM